MLDLLHSAFYEQYQRDRENSELNIDYGGSMLFFQIVNNRAERAYKIILNHHAECTIVVVGNVSDNGIGNPSLISCR